jgi:hypothetical protein
MTQDEIVEMARQAGMMDTWDGWVSRSVYKASGLQTEDLIAFAKLVAAKAEARYMQLFLDPENQPTQFGTATEQYREQEINDENEMCAEVLTTSADAYDAEGKPAAAALLRMHAAIVRARGEA